MPKFRKIYSQNFSQSRKNLILGVNPPFWVLIRGFTAPKKARQGNATGVYPSKGATDQRLSGGLVMNTVLILSLATSRIQRIGREGESPGTGLVGKERDPERAFENSRLTYR